MTAAPGICKRCRHTDRYAGPLDSYGICGWCAEDLAAEMEAERMADLSDADFEQRLFDAREEAAYNARETRS